MKIAMMKLKEASVQKVRGRSERLGGRERGEGRRGKGGRVRRERRRGRKGCVVLGLCIDRIS